MGIRSNGDSRQINHGDKQIKIRERFERKMEWKNGDSKICERQRTGSDEAMNGTETVQR